MRFLLFPLINKVYIYVVKEIQLTKKLYKMTRNFILSVLLLAAMSIGHFTAEAQGEWKWGRTNKTKGYTNETGLLTVDNAGNVFTAVYHIDTAVFGTIVAPNPFVAKTDSLGVVSWVLNAVRTYISGMVTDAQGNLYVTAEYQTMTTLGTITLYSPLSGNEMLLTKISPSGTVLWAKNIMHGISGFESMLGMGPTYLAIDGAGNLILTADLRGNTSTVGTTTLTNFGGTSLTSDVLVAKFDSAGNNIWIKQFGGTKDDVVFGLAVADDGDFFISGAYSSDTFRVGTSFLVGVNGTLPHYSAYITTLKGQYMAKFDRNGNLSWLHALNRHENIISLATDAHKNVYVAGDVDSNVVLGVDTFRAGTGSISPFFGRYDSSGNYKWAVSSNGYGMPMAYRIIPDKCGNIWVSGSMTNTSMTFSGHVLANPTLSGSSDLNTFLLEYDTSGAYITGFVMKGGADDAMDMAIDNRGNFFITGDYWQDTMIFNRDTLLPDSIFEGYFVAKYQYPSCYSSGGGNDTTTDTTHHVNAVQSVNKVAGVMLYPNPPVGEFTITTTNAVLIKLVELYDITGRIIYEEQPGSSSTTIGTAHLKPGFYTCRIYAGGDVFYEKIVIR